MNNKDKWMKCAMNLLNYLAENPEQATKLANSNQLKILKESIEKMKVMEMLPLGHRIAARKREMENPEMAAANAKARFEERQWKLFDRLDGIVTSLEETIEFYNRAGDNPHGVKEPVEAALNALMKIPGYQEHRIKKN